MLVAGIDDAGRGSVVGPLVIAGVLMKHDEIDRLSILGVRDSKLLTPGRRASLYPEIKRISKGHTVIKIQPSEIDHVVLNAKKLHKLNWLEAKVMAEVIATLKPDKAYVDASDVLEDRFRQDILDCLMLKIPIVSEHKADRTYPIVSAASIIAKVERDREIMELSKVHGEIGSGYPSDPRTIGFLERCIGEAESYPDFVRRSWKTAKRTKEVVSSRQSRFT